MADSKAKIRNKVVKALSDFFMLKDGDNVLIAVSGGIDSSAMFSLLVDIRKRAPFSFSLQPALVEHGFPATGTDLFSEWIEKQGYKLKILPCETYPMAKSNLENGKSPCQMCSRLRRGVLYTYAAKKGYSKIALGHNRDDLNETVLLNMFFSGKLAGMAPKFQTKNNKNIIIRPLCYLSKNQIREYAEALEVPIIENDFCQNIPNNSRYLIRNLLSRLENENPTIGGNMLAAQSNIMPSLLMDARFWDFEDQE